MSPSPQVVSPDPPFAEGPVWVAADDAIVCTSVSLGTLSRVSRGGSCTQIADTSGGAHGAAPGPLT